MQLIGLTGGIGSGKTTVSGMFSDGGLTVIDADAITRELQQPGHPVLTAVIDAFGPRVLLPQGGLNRQALAEIVFSDATELARLNAIMHPAVGAEINQRLEQLRESDRDVILDVPLLVESGREDLDLLVVVDLDPDVAVQRLVARRGFTETDARARMLHQADRATRLAHADVVIDNNGSFPELARQVDQLIGHLTARRR